MKITVIVPTYNRPKALELSLRSLSMQSLLPDEVLIADDGSGQETRDTISRLKEELKAWFLIRHVWQEDIGFRKPRILNETVRQSTGDYLVFLDGDCMAHRHFIRFHVEKSTPDAILSGKRVDIGKALTDKLLREGRIVLKSGLMLMLDSFMSAKPRSRKVLEGIVIRNRLLRKIMHRDRINNDGVWGCNFSLYKELFMAINGCDEDFLDGSIEDNDIGIRVINQGKRIISVRNLANIFHLWHQSSWNFDNQKYQSNLAIMNRRIANREPYCLNGITKRNR
jgi:glycosyltransferase involved in cell wall biosynthesis